MDEMKNWNQANRKKALKLPCLVTVLASLIVIASFFLPLASANEKYRNYLEGYAQELNVPEVEMTNQDVAHISMYDFARTYWVVFSTVDQTLATVVTSIIGATGILSLITLLFVMCRKPIAVVLFNLLTLASYYILVWDFKVRGVMPNSQYDWGIGYYLYYIGLVLVFAGAIWMWKKKRQLKQQMKVQAYTDDVNEK